MTRFLIFLGMLCFPFSVAAQGKIGTKNTVDLVFSNQDMLKGFATKGTANDLTWESPLLARPAELELSEVLYWEQTSPVTALPDDHTARLELNSSNDRGSVIFGKLVGISENHDVTLETSYAGTLTVKRPFISTLTLLKRTSTYYSGPQRLESWHTFGDSRWSLDSRGLTSPRQGAIARDLPFPNDLFELTLELSWESFLNPELKILTSDSSNLTPDNHYRLKFEHRHIILAKHWIDEAGELNEFVFPNSVSIRNTGLRDRESAEFTISMNRGTGEIKLSVDGTTIGGWVDQNPQQGRFGNGFQIMSGSLPLTIGSIQLTSWDGLLESSVRDPEVRRPTISKDEQAAGFQAIGLRNGDSITAKVKTIEDGQIQLQTPFGGVSVPTDRMKNIALRPLKEEPVPEYDEAKREAGDVSARFPSGDSLVFQLRSFNGTKAQIYSQYFGNAEIDLSVFSSIDFNLYTEHIRQLRRKLKR